MELYLLKWEHSGKRLQSKRHRTFFIQIKDRALKVRCKTLPNSSLSIDFTVCYSVFRGEDLAWLWHGGSVLVWLSLWNSGGPMEQAIEWEEMSPTKAKIWANLQGPRWQRNDIPESSSMQIAGSSLHWFFLLGSASCKVTVSRMLRLWKNSSLCVGCSQGWRSH